MGSCVDKENIMEPCRIDIQPREIGHLIVRVQELEVVQQHTTAMLDKLVSGLLKVYEGQSVPGKCQDCRECQRESEK